MNSESLNKKLYFAGMLVMTVLLLLSLQETGFAAKSTKPQKSTPTPEATPTAVPYMKNFTVYCPVGDIKFGKAFWEIIIKTAEEFKMLANPCITIEGFATLETVPEQDKELAKNRAEWVKKCLITESIPDIAFNEIKAAEPVTIPAGTADREKLKANRVEITITPCDPNRPLPQRQFETDPLDPFRIIIKS